MKKPTTYDVSIIYKNDKKTKDEFRNMIIDHMLNRNSLRKEKINGGKSN